MTDSRPLHVYTDNTEWLIGPDLEAAIVAAHKQVEFPLDVDRDRYRTEDLAAEMSAWMDPRELTISEPGHPLGHVVTLTFAVWAAKMGTGYLFAADS